MDFLVCDIKSLNPKQVVVDCRFNIEQGKSVMKVLSVSAKPYLTTCECAQNEARFCGKVFFKLIYLTEEGEIITLENISDFNEECKSEGVVGNEKSSVDFVLVDVTTPSVKSNEVRVACVLDATVKLTDNKKLTYESEANEDVCYQKKVVDIWENISSVDESFDVTDEIRISGSMEKIISYDVDLIVKDCFASLGFVCVSGDVSYSFIYEREEEGERKLVHYCQKLPFKQEIALSESKKECYFSADLMVNSSDVKVNVVLDNNSNIIKFISPIRVRGELFENKIIDCISDAYMVDYECELKNEKLVTITNPKSEAFESVESGNYELGGEGEYGYIGYTAQNVTLTSLTSKGDGVDVEGLISASVLLNYEGGMTAINCEFPFKTHLKCEKNEHTFASLSLINLDIALNGRVLNIEARVGYYISSYGKGECTFVSKIEKTVEKEKPDCGVEIVFARENQTLFDIGKMFSVSENMLLEQNKDVVLPLKEGDKLVIYRQKIVNFN